MGSDLTHLVKIELPERLFDELEAACDEAGITGITSWGRLGEGNVDVAVYCDDLSSAEASVPVLEKLLVEVGAPEDAVCQIDTIEAEDWQNSWKKFFKATKVSDSVVVRPSWEEWGGEGPYIDVVIDPGMTFGTGLHATTRACINFLDKVAGQKKSFLDAGCGSGILSIAAAKLGYGPVTSFDVDEMAVKCCRANLARNRVEANVVCAPVEEVQISGEYEFVAVNILAPIILNAADRIGGFVAGKGGYLALAGIRREQFAMISERFVEMGFSPVDQIAEDDWLSGLFVLS